MATITKCDGCGAERTPELHMHAVRIGTVSLDARVGERARSRDHDFCGTCLGKFNTVSDPKNWQPKFDPPGPYTLTSPRPEQYTLTPRQEYVRRRHAGYGLLPDPEGER